MTLLACGARIGPAGTYRGKPLSCMEGDVMSDEERKTFEEGEEGPEREETLQDLDVAQEDAEDVKGGMQDYEKKGH